MALILAGISVSPVISPDQRDPSRNADHQRYGNDWVDDPILSNASAGLRDGFAGAFLGFALDPAARVVGLPTRLPGGPS
jgi:hypothetical protein